jgi:hypothetical protein
MGLCATALAIFLLSLAEILVNFKYSFLSCISLAPSRNETFFQHRRVVVALEGVPAHVSVCAKVQNLQGFGVPGCFGAVNFGSQITTAVNFGY